MKPDYYHNNGLDLFNACKMGLVSQSDFEAFCKLNVIKYVLRYKAKNGVEDLFKAEDYLKQLKDLNKE